jgi:probable phosphoglycerate mutase
VELVLVRHALPVRVDAAAEGRVADPGLAAAGRAQADRLAAYLADEPVDAVWTSPLRRARQTAAPLLAALGLTPVVADGLAEFDQHAGSYVPVEELRAANDERWQLLARGELYGAPDQLAGFRDRVVGAVERAVRDHPGGRVVLVCHAGVINAYVGHLLGIGRALWFAPAYTSITRVGAARDGRRGVVSLNETGHVRDLLRRPGSGG